MSGPVIVDGLLYGADAMVADWVKARIPQQTEPFHKPVAIGVMVGEELLAGVVWHTYTGHDIHVSCAADSPRWARPRILRNLFAYPFGQLGVRRVTATTDSGNARTRRFLEGIGMTREGVLRQALPDGSDIVIYGLLRGDCRWI